MCFLAVIKYIYFFATFCTVFTTFCTDYATYYTVVYSILYWTFHIWCLYRTNSSSTGLYFYATICTVLEKFGTNRSCTNYNLYDSCYYLFLFSTKYTEVSSFNTCNIHNPFLFKRQYYIILHPNIIKPILIGSFRFPFAIVCSLLHHFSQLGFLQNLLTFLSFVLIFLYLATFYTLLSFLIYFWYASSIIVII